MMHDAPLFLRFLSDKLSYRYRSQPPILGYALYRVDLSEWKLNLSSRTLVIWVKESELQARSAQHIMDSLTDVLREIRYYEPAIVLVDGDTTEMRGQVQGSLLLSNPVRNRQLVIIGKAEQQAIQTSQRPSGDLRDLISEQLPISMLAPYETTAPVSGSRFFGRDQELNRVLKNPDPNFIILGIRRIGKSSLMQEIKRRMSQAHEEEGTDHIVYLDCSLLSTPDQYILEIARALDARETVRLQKHDPTFFFPNFLERMSRKHKKKLVIFLDEVDFLFQMERQRNNWNLLRLLRGPYQSGACQYIMAGFDVAFKEQHDSTSPFYHFAQEIYLKNFTVGQAHQLIVTPMESLGVRFENQQQVESKIYNDTFGHPNLLQYYCSILVRHLDETGERIIGMDNLVDVLNDEQFRNTMLASFMQNTSVRDKLMVYALLSTDRTDNYTQSYMDAALRRRGVTMTASEIENACQALKLAGFFSQVGKQYDFLSSVFVQVLRNTYEIDYLLTKAKEEYHP